MRTALVIGTGLIGTSVALALAGRGVRVHLEDHDADQARTAASLGAGTDRPPEGPVDLAVVAVPPAHIPAVLAAAQRRKAARGYLDVGSVKGGPRREAEALGCDPATYLGTHPMSGREISGPLAATADLFEGRPWVLTPTPETDTEVLNLALELVSLCRAVPVVMDADAHDRAVALVSHTPQLLSSLVAARLEGADETAVRLCGQGIRDVTRIAASDPGMWIDILSANPGPVADVLAAVAKRPGGDGAGAARAGVRRRDRAHRRRGGHRGGAAPRQQRPGPDPGQARAGPGRLRDGGGAHQRPARRTGPHLRRRRTGLASTSRTSGSSTPPASRPTTSSSWSSRAPPPC
ncbi:prephenate dehydrogenase [Streptomyces radiopugnans]|nr:prephenate dehydrogenase [Streptomyces radiopugnans]